MSLQNSEGPFRFTLDTKKKMLNGSQRGFYEKNGFVVIPGLVPPDLLDECRQRFLDIVDGVVDPGAILRMKGMRHKHPWSGLRLKNKYIL